ncbi:MAG TPA: serine hydrolase domain-containing protein, partial [Candidatus Saccharimonadales bacterium]|nr:serine hydrolase domain-containing protein [Candidatus Saccharimonadales bacterium]
VREEIFEPLGMRDTALGAPDEWWSGPEPTMERVPEIRVPEAMRAETTWNWNSRYWRMLGSPWGGMLTTPADLARFAQMMLSGGSLGEARILSPAAVAAATQNQLAEMPDVPADDRRCRPWGLGWRLAWPAHSANFGDFVGPRTYGHWGATGTVLWIDPDRECFLIALTTQPQDPQGQYLTRLSNAVSAALV